MSSFPFDTLFNSLTITSTSSVSTTSSTNRHLVANDPHRLSITNSTNPVHQRRTSIVSHHQRRNSQLRKGSFTTSTLVCVRLTNQ